jgi:hypothetical protein
MTAVTELFVVGAVLAAALSLISIWAPRRLPIKGTALATSVLFLPLGYASLVDLLSKPKPVDMEWWLSSAAEAEVLASRLVEGEGIYLWLQLPEVAEPRAYVLPWDRGSAEELQQATREAEREGDGVQMRLPFEPSLEEREPRFYARPQPAPPPKDLAEPLRNSISRPAATPEPARTVAPLPPRFRIREAAAPPPKARGLTDFVELAELEPLLATSFSL